MSDNDEVRLLFPSRILQRKGIEECIKALSKLPRRFTLSLPSFAHAEDAAYRQTIRELIDGLELQDRVFCPNTVTTPEMMRTFYASADIVVIPSYYEGFGIVAVEAMSWGVPVIASAVGGLGEIVQDRVNGLAVKPQSPDDIVEAVVELVGDKELVSTLVSNAIETVNKTFNRKAHMRQIEAVYKESLLQIEQLLTRC
jgi:glycosyltransferase involved in cell wall biosynthesis